MSRNFLKGNHEGSLTKKSIKISARGGGGGGGGGGPDPPLWISPR